MAVLRNNAKHVAEATPQFAVCNEHPESIQPNEPSGAHFISGASTSKKRLRISGAACVGKSVVFEVLTKHAATPHAPERTKPRSAAVLCQAIAGQYVG